MVQKPVLAERPGVSPAVPSSASEPSFKEVLVELWHNTEKLVRQEIALASAELDLKAQKLKREVVSLALGGAILHAALLTLVAALVLLLAEAMKPWLAALIVGALTLVVGYVLVKRGSQISSDDVVPTRTVENVKKDVETFTEAHR